jgi:hypothetical protein
LASRDRPHRGRPPTEDANARNPAVGAKKTKRKHRGTPYSPQRSVLTPKRWPGTALGVLGKLREPCAVRARPNPADGRAALAGTETARVWRAHFSKRNIIHKALVRLHCLKSAFLGPFFHEDSESEVRLQKNRPTAKLRHVYYVL